MNIEISADHETSAIRIGNELHYTCGKCDYHRVMNVNTLETEVLVHGDPVTHSGVWIDQLFDIETTLS